MTHRVLIIGAGSIGERHLRCFAATGRATVALVEPKDELRHAVSTRYGVAAFNSLEAALEHRHDAAVVATPAPLHVPISTRLAEAGLHLLIEKPLAVTTAGVDALADLVQRKNLVAAVAYVYRAHPALAAMREAVVSGRFGRPVQLVAVAGQHFPTYRPAYRSTYYTDPAAGGGAIQDALTHVLNASDWLVGPATRVIADAAHQVLPDVHVEDTAHVLARHDRVLASYSLNQHQAPNEVTMTVVCETGTTRFEMHASQWRWAVDPRGSWESCPTPLERDTLFVRQATSFLDAIEQKSPPLCTLDEGKHSLLVNIAVLSSVAETKWRAIKP